MTGRNVAVAPARFGPARRIAAALAAVVTVASLVLGIWGNVAAADQLGLPGWAWFLIALGVLAGALSWVILEQHQDVRRLVQLLEERGLDIVVEVQNLDHDWCQSYSDPLAGDDGVSMRIPNVYVVNRSAASNANLRFEAELTVDNFEDPAVVEPEMDHTVFRNDQRDPAFLPNPLHVDTQSHRRGHLLLAVPFNGRRWVHSGGLLLSHASLTVRDEQSGEQFTMSIPGRHETRPRDSTR